MPDFSDVVRHVIVRLVVDQAGFGEELAKARGKLKELEKAERDSNTARSKDAERVTKAVEKQSQAIRENIGATEQHSRAFDRDAERSGEHWAESTKRIQANTKAQTDAIRTVENARDGEFKRQLARDNAEATRLRQDEKTRLESDARVSREQQKLNQQLAAEQHKINDQEYIRSRTRNERLIADLEKLAEAQKKVRAETGKAEAHHERALYEADAAGSVADMAASDARNAAHRANFDAGERRVRSLRDAKKFQEELNNLSARGNVLEQQAAAIAERRAEFLRRATSRRGIGGFISSASGAAGDVATGVGRTFVSAPRSFARGGREFDERRLAEPTKDLISTASRGERVVASFFSVFTRDGERAIAMTQRLRSQFTEFFRDLNRARSGGTGGNLVSGLVGNVVGALSSVNSVFDGFGKSLLSFKGLIVAGVAALGPLAAALGAVSAAALGLVSDLAGLAGGLLALPGLIGAAVAGFGALALVMKPLTNVFSAYSAAQKEVTKNSRAAASAALDYQQAVLSQQKAELAYNRAQQDLPRAQQALNAARRQAARDIQDYRLQLQKLKFDEEGAQLDVDSAKQNYRRTLADPTKNALERRIARHDVEGALFDKRDQQVAGQRLLEDSQLAFKKGVEGADAVVAAERAVQDATYGVRDAYLSWQKAIIATQQAAQVKSAGGTAAAALRAELAKLPPETRKVAKAILDLLDGPYKKMRDRLSENIFGLLSKETGKFKDLLNELGTFLTPASVAIGKLAKSALDLFTNPEWKRFFSEQGAASGKIIASLGAAALTAADGFKAIVEAARPFTQWVADAIKGVAESFSGWAKSDKGRRGVTDFLEITKKRIQELWPVVKNFAAGFAGFFDALNKPAGGKEDFTTRFNKGLGGMALSFRKLGEEAAKPNSGFRKWLDNVIPLIKDVVHFLGQAGSFIGKLFSNPDNIKEAEALLKNLADKWLPELADIFDKLSKSGFISKLAAGIGAAFQGINDFLDNGGLEGLKTFGSALETAGHWFSNIVGFLSSMPGLLQVVGVAFATVFGGALIAKLSGLTTLFKGLFALIRGGINLTKSVANPANDESNDRTQQSRSRRDRAQQTRRQPRSRLGRIFGRNPGNIPDIDTPESGRGRNNAGTTDPRNTTRGSRRGGILGRVFGRRTPVSRLDDFPGGSGSGSSSRGGGLFSRIATNAKTSTVDAITGHNEFERILPRMENYLRQIEINTRRLTSGSGGGRGRGGTGPTGPETTPHRPRGGPRPDLSTDSGRSIREQLDPYGAGNRGEATTTRRERSTAPRQSATYSDERIQQNARRTKVGLPPLPPDIQPERTGGPITGHLPVDHDPNAIHTFPVEPNSATDQERRRRTTEQARRTRLGLPPLGPDEPTPYRTPPNPRNLPAGREQRLQAVVDSSERRRRGQGIIPSFDENFPPRRATVEPTVSEQLPTTVQPNERRSATTETGAQRRARLARERYERRNAARPQRPTAAVEPDIEIPDEEPEPERQPKRRYQTPEPPVLADAGRDLTPYPGLEAGYTVPTAEQTRAQRPTQQRDPDTGRFLPRAEEPSIVQPTVAQPRDAGGRFLPRSAAVGGDVVLPARPVQERDSHGRFVPRPQEAEPRRTSPSSIGSGLPSRPSLAETGHDPSVYTQPRRQSRLGRLGGALFPSNDEGSFGGFGGFGGFAAGTDEPRSARRSRTTRPARTRARRGRGIGGVLGSLFGLGAAAAVPDVVGDFAGVVGGEDEYDTGYDDGFAAANQGGGFDLPDTGEDERRPSRKERRQARREARQTSRGERETRTRGGRRGPRSVRSRLGSTLANEAETVEGELLDRRGMPAEEGGRAARRGLPGRERSVERSLVRRGVPAAEREVASLGRSAGRLGRFARLGGGLARGLGGGLVGAALSGVAAFAGDAAIDKFVKNDEDKGSLSRGLGAVSTGAGIGATIGSVIPGVGTVIGGAVGGLVGGAYSLVKDKNLRNFVGGKISGAAKGVGGFLSSAGGAVADIFTGGDAKPGLGGAAATVLGPLGGLLSKTDIGKAIFDSLNKAGSKIGAFFTKTIPDWFHKGVHGITDFFTKTLPSLPGRAFDAFFHGLGRIIRFFIHDIPHAASVAWRGITNFFTKILPEVASTGWQWVVRNLWDPFVNFIEGIPGFFTKTIPNWFATVQRWMYRHVHKPVEDFVTKTIPQFFTVTIPKWFREAPHWFKAHVIDNITHFFTVTLPSFFTPTLPNAIRALPGYLYKNLVQPVLDFFKGLWKHIHITDLFSGAAQLWSWAKSLFNRAAVDVAEGAQGKMSGGLVTGIYQGMEDHVKVLATPDEFVVRRSKVMQPAGKQFLTDFNEGRVDPAGYYKALTASMAPPVMSMVPPDAQSFTGAVPTVVNHTVNHAPVMGDVTINNPVRERSEHSLRRQVQIAAIRHRR